MFGISGFELLIIAAFVLVIFGPEKLPELARTIGRAVNMFKSAQQDMERVIRAEMGPEELNLDPFAPSKKSTTVSSTSTSSPSASAASVWSATSDEDEEEEDEE